MVLPILLYGNPILKKKATAINSDYPNLEQLIQNMWDTMVFAKGVGLAAPQIGLSIRLFVVDSMPYFEDKKEGSGIKKVFINAEIIKESGKPWNFEEGCLSIPGIHGEVERKSNVLIKYQDEQFNWHEEEFDDINARVIQHEYDHIEGVLFVEKISQVRKQLISRKLEKIKKGMHDAKYPVRQ
ncbi:MAG TPA: peptide deformylase [Saprospiraceae bacterium]|nr:peptide deformylase [Saprospiraceae bacterium]